MSSWWPGLPIAEDAFEWGELTTADTWNERVVTPITSAVAFLEGDEDWITVSFLENGWTPYSTSGYRQFAYRKVAGMVEVRGLVKGGANGEAGCIYTLPEGYRPAAYEMFTAEVAGNSAGTSAVSTTGAVYVYQWDETASYISLQLCFEAATA